VRREARIAVKGTYKRRMLAPIGTSERYPEGDQSLEEKQAHKSVNNQNRRRKTAVRTRVFGVCQQPLSSHVGIESAKKKSNLFTKLQKETNKSRHTNSTAGL
jgi:hypothetical protein